MIFKNWLKNRKIEKDIPKSRLAYKECYVCRGKVDRFIPFEDGYDAIPAWFKKLDFVGSDLDNYLCPL